MDVSTDRVLSSLGTGNLDSQSKWQMNTYGKKVEDFETFFRAFAEKILSNQGSFKVDGNLVFEFIPKAFVRSEKLISPETAFYFHRMAEGVIYTNKERLDLKTNNPALDSYNYQKNLAPLVVETLDRYMPPV